MNVYRIQRQDPETGSWRDDTNFREISNKPEALALVRDLRGTQPNVRRKVIALRVNS